MERHLSYRLEEAASYFYGSQCTENELYLLTILLDLCKEYNNLTDQIGRASCRERV